MGKVALVHITAAAIVVAVDFGSAEAQTPPGAVPDLSPFIGNRIEVTDESGYVYRGQLIRVSEAGVVVEINQQQREIASSSISDVSRWRKDSVANGILIGTGLGFVIPAFIGAAVDTGEPGEAAALLVPPGVAIGLAVGWIVDALHQTKISIFPVAQKRVTVQPMVSGTRRGLRASLRF
jgi:hypothetical protein